MNLKKSYLAFDLGAESGRAILGKLNDKGLLKITEIHRFPNSIIQIRNNLHWNILELYQEILKGMQICQSCADSPSSIGIDTWGVDFTLLDENGNLIGMPFVYRDKRTQGIMEEFFKKYSKEKLYKQTGIQLMEINTIFQLYSMVRDRSPQLKIVSDLLFMPDIFNYFLTGIKKTEFTFATTSQLYNPKINKWEKEIFKHLGISIGIMQKIVQPGTIIGRITPSISNKTGLKNVPVVAVASHDTGSAVAAVPTSTKNFAYISLGTWSLIGIESQRPIINEKTLKYNFTNEGGICGTFRVLKNIMGMWLLQESKRIWSKVKKYSYSELVNMAKKSKPFVSIIDPDYSEFMNAVDMPFSIQKFCQETDQTPPQNIGEIVRTILESLALAHCYTLRQLKEISNRNIEHIHIIGGGSQNHLLCQFTANATGIPVYAGPVEATAIGNILVQAMAFDQIKSIEELREVVRNSFKLNIYKPHHIPDWDIAYTCFVKLKQIKRRKFYY